MSAKLSSYISSVMPSPYQGKQIIKQKNIKNTSKISHPGSMANQPYVTKKCPKPNGNINSTSMINNKNKVIELNLKALRHPAGNIESHSKFNKIKDRGRDVLLPNSKSASNEPLSAESTKSRTHAHFYPGETSRSNVQSLVKPVSVAGDGDEFEETKEGKGAIITTPKVQVMKVRLPWETLQSEINTADTTKVKSSCDNSINVIRSINKRKTLENIEVIDIQKIKKAYTKCKCPRDKNLPCCIKGANWLKMLFERKGINFDHQKYKKQYEVFSLFSS